MITEKDLEAVVTLTPQGKNIVLEDLITVVNSSLGNRPEFLWIEPLSKTIEIGKIVDGYVWLKASLQYTEKEGDTLTVWSRFTKEFLA